MTDAESQAITRENAYLKQRMGQLQAEAAAAAAKVGMTQAEEQSLRRENEYLKQRLVQLQADVTGLSAEGDRLRQRLDHAAGPAPVAAG